MREFYALCRGQRVAQSGLRKVEKKEPQVWGHRRRGS